MARIKKDLEDLLAGEVGMGHGFSSVGSTAEDMSSSSPQPRTTRERCMSVACCREAGVAKVMLMGIGGMGLTDSTGSVLMARSA